MLAVQSVTVCFVSNAVNLFYQNKQVVSKTCSHIVFPNHPQRAHRQPCNTLLMKTVRTKAGTTALYPRRLYCYRSIIESVKEMLTRRDFFRKCEAWRTRKTGSDTLADIYDGSVWKEFANPGGISFLSLPYNFAFTLNVDWFQPFKHTTHSTGVIYLAIQNLPRCERLY